MENKEKDEKKKVDWTDWKVWLVLIFGFLVFWWTVRPAFIKWDCKQGAIGHHFKYQYEFDQYVERCMK